MESVATSSAATAMDLTDAVSVASSSVSSFQNAQLIAATFGFDASSAPTITTAAAPTTATTTTATSNTNSSPQTINPKQCVDMENSGNSRRRGAHDEESMADADSDIMGTVSSRDVTSIEEDYFSDVAMSADQDTQKDTGGRRIRKQARQNYKEDQADEEDEETSNSRKSSRKPKSTGKMMTSNSGDEVSEEKQPVKSPRKNSLPVEDKPQPATFQPPRKRGRPAKATTLLNQAKKSKEDIESNKTVKQSVKQSRMASRSSIKREEAVATSNSGSNRRESPRIKVKSELKLEEDDYASNDEEIYVKKTGYKSGRLNARGKRSAIGIKASLATLATEVAKKTKRSDLVTPGKPGRKKLEHHFSRKSSNIIDKVKGGKATGLKRLGRKKRRGRKPRNYREEDDDDVDVSEHAESRSNGTEQASDEDDENSQPGLTVSDCEMKEETIEKKKKSPVGSKTQPKPISLNSTYKVRIMPRRVSLSTHSQSNDQAQSGSQTPTVKTEPSSSFTGPASVPSSPLKTVKSSSSLLSLTPSKHLSSTNLSSGGSNALVSNILTNQSSTSSNASQQTTNSDKQASENNSTTQQQLKFECPECDKKFYSYFGLVQHIDQHPTLSVTCSLCEITFETHQALVAHSMNIHGGQSLDGVNASTTTGATDDSPATPPSDLLTQSDSMDARIESKTDSDDRKLNITTSTSHTQVNSGSVAAANFGAKTSSSHTLTTSTASVTSNNSQAKNLQVKTKSLQDQDLLFPADNTGGGVKESDLLSLAVPSIMTRTSRQQNSTKQLITPSISQAIAAATSTTPMATNNTTATLNTQASHSLTTKTSGFADLAFIDISCIHFPRIAQNYCELWPRKLQRKQQALHNYKCSMCGFYFPTRASLILHKMKKKFATSKLKLGPNTLQELENTIRTELAEIDRPSTSEEKRPKPCELFMTNSKYLDYERTLDEVISKIEEEVNEKPVESAEPNEQTFMSWFGLVESNKTASTQQQSHVEKLLLKLRQQLMLEINYQFNVELDRWKLTHSSLERFNQFHNDITDSSSTLSSSSTIHQYSNKIYLKPSVNLNRPLLIRSKKLKRNGTNYVPLPTFNNNNKMNKTSSSSNLKASAATTITEKTNIVKSNSSRQLKEPAPTISKPLFTATSGAFSGTATNSLNKLSQQSKAAAIIEPNEDTTGNGKKRRRKQQLSKIVDQPDEIENINVAKSTTAKSANQQQHQNQTATVTTTVNAFKRVKSESKPITSRQAEKSSVLASNRVMEPPPTLTKNLASQRGQVVRNASNGRSQTAAHYSTMPPQPPKLFRMPSAGSNINHINTRAIETENSSSNSSLSSSSSGSMPAPPTLYKAPKTTHPSSVYSNNNNVVNSSRFASASGMNFNLFKNGTNLNNMNNRYNNMPKLTPVVSKSTDQMAANNGPSSMSNGQQLLQTSQAAADVSSAMPKLKPILPKPRHHASYSTKQPSTQFQNIIPRPPQLSNATATKSTTIPNGVHSHQSIPLILNRSRLHNPSGNKSLPTPPALTSSAIAGAAAMATESNGDGLSLKCKFCRAVFKGQQQFFQHVILDHARMLKQKLDKAAANGTTSTSPGGSSGSGKTDNSKPATTTCSTGRNSF